VNKVNETTTIRDTAQGESISEHRHPYGPTPSRGQARQEHVSTKSLGSPQMVHVYTFTIQKKPPTHNRMGHLAILFKHASLFPLARKPATKPLGPTPPPPQTMQHFQGEGQRTSLRTSTTPLLPKTTPPPHPLLQIELLYCLYSCILYSYLYLLCLIVFYLTPYFDSVCQAMRM